MVGGAPGIFVFRLLRDRRWNLRTWLTLPLVVAWWIVALRFFVDENSIQRVARTELGVLSAAAISTVYNVFPLLIIVWSMQRRWRRVVILALVALLITLVTGFLTYQSAANKLGPLEQFDWTWRGSANVYLPAAVIAGWLAVFVIVVKWIVSKVNSRRQNIAHVE